MLTRCEKSGILMSTRFGKFGYSYDSCCRKLSMSACITQVKVCSINEMNI